MGLYFKSVREWSYDFQRGILHAPCFKRRGVTSLWKEYRGVARGFYMSSVGAEPLEACILEEYMGGARGGFIWPVF